MNKKPVILLVIDTLMTVPLQEAMARGKAPALQFLMQHGQLYPHMVSSFPTMSVTIDSTLLTGTYADQHKIPALNWYSEKEKRVINYGTGVTEAYKHGMVQVMQDMFFRLNNAHLSSNVKTIHETLHEAGKPSASINGYVYRGPYQHEISLPSLLSPFIRSEDHWKTAAPYGLSLGGFAQLSPSLNPFSKLIPGNLKSSAQELQYLITTRRLPPFTICYFQTLDLIVHSKGPQDISGIQKADRQLQTILNSYDSWDESIREHTWIVMGDNGQTRMEKRKKWTLIDLQMKFQDYKIARLGQSVQETDQLVLCANQRMAYIYTLDPQLPVEELAHLLQQDDRIDIIAWRNDDEVHIVSGSNKGKLVFSASGDEYVDPYDQTWSLKGDLHLLDITLEENYRIRYEDYPDALARMYGALHSHDGRFVVVNAKPGFEFVSEASPTHHRGAAHGSLYKQEGLVPMIVAGTEEHPPSDRIVDLKSWLMKLVQ